MILSVLSHMVVYVILGMMALLSAQNLTSVTCSFESDIRSKSKIASVLPNTYEIPFEEKAVGQIPVCRMVSKSLPSQMLGTLSFSSCKVESIIDLSVLRQPPLYLKAAVSAHGQPYEVTADGLQAGLALISAIYRGSDRRELTLDCTRVALSTEQQIRMDMSKVFEVVEFEVTSNPGCACEIVKTAIKACEADVEKVVLIVETCANAAPDSLRIASQCAIAVMPEAISEIQALLTRLDPSRGETQIYSSKSSNCTQVAAVVSSAFAHPLDLPQPSPPIMPPPIMPLPITEVNP